MQRPELDFDATPEELVSVERDHVRLGRYELRYEIASGGMATVYLARARGPGGFERPLAIKRIHPHLARKRDFVDMFFDEARVTARLSHPNVCSVFDFGEADGAHFIAMEYLVGQSLATVLSKLTARPDVATSPRWLALAARIIEGACEGLHAAHELRDEQGAPLGVVHRDATPHNVFVTYDGAVKVVDFGVALAEGRTHQTQSRMLKGKLAYMPPEQVRGERLDRRADVWSMGVCLWELLTVRRLFAVGSDAAIVEAVARGPIPPPSTYAPVPAALDAIVSRALSRELDRRYPTTRALGRELGAYAGSMGVGAGLADLAELMDELFAEERAQKLGVVARVLGAAGSEWSSESGEHQTRGSVPTPSPQALLGRLEPEEAPPPRTSPINAPASISGGFRARVPAGMTPASGHEATAIVPFPVEPARLPAAPAVVPSTAFVAPPPSDAEEIAAPSPRVEPAIARSTTRPWIWAAGVVGSALALALVIVSVGGEPEHEPITIASAPLPTSTLTHEETSPARAPAPTPSPSIAPSPAPAPAPSPSPSPSTAPSPLPSTSPAPAPSPATSPSPAPSTSSPRDRRPRPAPARETATGSVNVAARGGWAEIFVGGESRGRTPTRLTLPVGRQTLELRPGDGSPTQRVTVVVREEVVERVVVTLGQ